MFVKCAVSRNDIGTIAHKAFDRVIGTTERNSVRKFNYERVKTMNAIMNRLAINAVSYVVFRCDQDFSFGFAWQQDKGSFVPDTNAGCSVFNETR